MHPIPVGLLQLGWCLTGDGQVSSWCWGEELVCLPLLGGYLAKRLMEHLMSLEILTLWRGWSSQEWSLMAGKLS